jgi:WD40 repeat protein
MEVSSTKRAAHNGNIRDLDYNPNKPYTLLTCGDDRKLKIWDLRKPEKPLVTLCGHSHWVWTAKYNPSHDQLILSGGSDNLVNLWRIASCSSAPWLGGGDDENGNGEEDPPNVRVSGFLFYSLK